MKDDLCLCPQTLVSHADGHLGGQVLLMLENRHFMIYTEMKVLQTKVYHKYIQCNVQVHGTLNKC